MHPTYRCNAILWCPPPSPVVLTDAATGAHPSSALPCIVQWLSCSCFFYQYFRCYSPVAFPKKYDKDGAYVRHWLPQLRNYPAKYIYEPWKAPIADQKAAGCIIGVDYPKPIVEHQSVSKENMGRMAKAYEAHKAGIGSTSTAKSASGESQSLKASGSSGKRPMVQQKLPAGKRSK